MCYTFIHKNFNKKYECKNKGIGSIGEGADVLSSNLSSIFLSLIKIKQVAKHKNAIWLESRISFQFHVLRQEAVQFRRMAGYSRTVFLHFKSHTNPALAVHLAILLNIHQPTDVMLPTSLQMGKITLFD